MALLGLDLGGTKLASAVFDDQGNLLQKEILALNDQEGSAVGRLITTHILNVRKVFASKQHPVNSIGIGVPGIYRARTETVWAPNIPGWTDYPLLNEIKTVVSDIPVTIDSDRACYILGEVWKGRARQCTDAVFLSVGTGIGAGILVNGEVLRGSHDVAGAIGWMALDPPFRKEYKNTGCFESIASGDGIARLAKYLLREQPDYDGELRGIGTGEITSHQVLNAYNHNDSIARVVIGRCIQFWGMAVANLISLLNPEKIIFGGGVFGPAAALLPQIKAEAEKWAQPIGVTQVTIEQSGLQGDAGVFGAGFLALKNSGH